MPSKKQSSYIHPPTSNAQLLVGFNIVKDSANAFIETLEKNNQNIYGRIDETNRNIYVNNRNIYNHIEKNNRDI